jgi:hypothetical protein
VQIASVVDTSEKHAAQRFENVRKNSLGNYKSAALNQLSYAGVVLTYNSVFAGFIKSLAARRDERGQDKNNNLWQEVTSET